MLGSHYSHSEGWRFENIMYKILFLVFVASNCANSARILGVFPMPGISHYILDYKLMKGLAEAGHDVTMISPYKLKELPKNGNYTDVVLDGVAEEFQTHLNKMKLLETDSQFSLERMKEITKTFIGHVNSTFNDPNVQKLLQSNQKFDVVIMEQFANEALKVFSYIYNCPLITLSSIGPNSWVNPTVGNPEPMSTVPHLLAGQSSGEMTLFMRVKNVFCYMLEYLINKYYMHPKNEEIMHHAFPDAPPLHDLYTNVSLVLLNSHTSIYKAVPVVPNMIEIGGYFIDPPKKLPTDLQNFLDSAKNGAIYFSMGSNLKSKDMSAERKKIILNVLGKLKQKVLWKFEEDLPGKPSNVMIKKWLPQQDILAHPNIKLFITHGGLLSTTETIYHGVPILALPVFADQPANAERAVAAGYGLKLNYNDPNFNEKTFSSLLNELLTNPKYKENVQRRSKLFHDRPQKPLETAIYWVEYVIRHKGAPHLRVAGIRMPWYKYFMIDVLAVLMLSVLIILYTLRFLFKKLFGRINDLKQNYRKIKTN